MPDAPERSGIDVVEALRRAGVSAYAAGELERSLGLFDEALAELAPGTEPERRALLMEARAATLLDLGRDDEAQLELEGAAALLPDEPRGEAHAVVLTALVALRAVAGRFADARPVAEQAVVAATAAGDPGLTAGARMMLGLSLAYCDEGDRAVAELEAAVGLAETAEDHALTLRGYLNLSDALQNLGRSHDAASVAAPGHGAGGAGRPHALGLWNAGDDQLRRGAVPPRPLGHRGSVC